MILPVIHDVYKFSDSRIRLTNTTSNHSGTVEFLREGVWKKVCDPNWGIHKAKVVCQLLGFPGALSANSARSHNAILDEASSRIDWPCAGNEEDKYECFSSSDFRNSCNLIGSPEASVTCDNSKWLVN